MRVLRSTRRGCLALAAVALAGCAAKSLPGYQHAYQGYDIPQSLLDRIAADFRTHGLRGAAITRDSTGRVKLVGDYANDDEVDQAFTIVQTNVGLKSTSPFYPQHVKVRRWEQDAARAMADYAASLSGKQPGAAAAGVRRALVIGINTFLDAALTPIQGEDDARVMTEALQRYGYRVTSLFGPKATKAAIEAAIAQVHRELRSDDTLFIYVSSHGTQPVPSHEGGDARKMSVIAYDSSLSVAASRGAGDAVSQALSIQRTAVKDTLFQDLAKRPTRATRVLIDTCYAGEILKNVPEDTRRFVLQQNGGVPEREGVSMAAWTGPGYAHKGIQFVPAGSARTGAASAAPSKPTATGRVEPGRAGYTMMTATSPGQKAWGPPIQVGTFNAPAGRKRELKGSFFTQTFVAWLEVHNGQVQPAFDHARAFTSDTVRRGTTEKQDPRLFSTMSLQDDDLWKL